jgi:hypothetical protein
VALQGFLDECQSGSFVTFLRNVAFENLTLVIHRTPQIMRFAVDLHEHLVEVPAPVAETPHPRTALTPDVGCEQRAEPIPPQPHRLVANVDAALEEQILNVAQRQRKADLHHDQQPDHLRRRMKIAERILGSQLAHPRRIAALHPARHFALTTPSRCFKTSGRFCSVAWPVFFYA